MYKREIQLVCMPPFSRRTTKQGTLDQCSVQRLVIWIVRNGWYCTSVVNCCAFASYINLQKNTTLVTFVCGLGCQKERSLRRNIAKSNEENRDSIYGVV